MSKQPLVAKYNKSKTIATKYYILTKIQHKNVFVFIATLWSILLIFVFLLDLVLHRHCRHPLLSLVSTFLPPPHQELQREKNSLTVQLDQSSRRLSQLEEEKKSGDQSLKRTQGQLDDLKGKLGSWIWIWFVEHDLKSSLFLTRIFAP